MSSEQTVQPKGYNENPDLLPMPKSEQRIGTLTFTFMMFSMNTCIPMFFLGPIGKSLGLDIWQAVVGATVGNLAAVLVMILNGHAGIKYGITFPVQLRSAFGFRGTHIPVILRGIAGTMWFGIEAYAGSLALMMIVLYAIGIPSEQVTPMAIRYLIIALLFYLGSFVIVMRRGLVRGIGRMADFAGPIMFLYFVWLAWWLSTNPEFAQRIPEVYVSTAGWASVNFLIYLAVQTNWWATVALNISDLSRGLRKWSALWVGAIVGIVLAQAGGTALGFYLVTMAQEVLPQSIIVKFAPGAIAIVLGLLFAFLAPWSTDITANAPPLIDILMSTFRMRWKLAVTVAAIIAFFAAPWWAVESGPAYVDYITAWAANYGILLGPFVGPMIGHYWIVSRTNIDLQRLYTFGSEGYWYKGGWGAAAYASWILTIILSYIIAYANPDYLLATVSGVPFPGGPIWYFAVIVSLILYLVFSKALKEW
jgi:NCS1 family nucleobase:cation symporter-1